MKLKNVLIEIEEINNLVFGQTEKSHQVAKYSVYIDYVSNLLVGEAIVYRIDDKLYADINLYKPQIVGVIGDLTPSIMIARDKDLINDLGKNNTPAVLKAIGLCTNDNLDDRIKKIKLQKQITIEP